MADFTVDQYRAAAKRAYEAGDIRSASELIEAGRALEARASPAMPAATLAAQRPAQPAPLPGMGSPSVPPRADDPAYADETKPPENLPAPDDGQTTFLHQLGSGINEGLSNTAGFVGNAVLGPVGRMMGYDTTEALKGAGERTGLIDTTAPQTAAQRIGRRVGQDVGAGAVMAPAAGVASAGGMVLNTLADVGSGLAGGVTSEVTDNPIANILASLAGGGGVIAAGSKARPKGPTRAEIEAIRDQSYTELDKSPVRLTDKTTETLKRYSRAKTAREGIDPILHPKATRMQEKVYEMQTPTLRKIEQRRQAVGRDVAGSADAGERRIGVKMKEAFDDVLASLTPRHVTGGTQDQIDDVVEALGRGRNASRKLHKLDDVRGAVDKAELRAASTGTGGNEINAIRQNLRRILDNPKLRRGYTKDEIEQIEKIVRGGGGGANTARLFGRLAPSTGGLQLAGQLGAVGPTGGASLVTAAIGEAAQKIGEKLTHREVKRLEDMILRGGIKQSARGLTEAQRAAARALMLTQAEQELPQ